MSCNGPQLLEFLREMRREVLDHYDVLTVGECPMIDVDLAAEITDAKSGGVEVVFDLPEAVEGRIGELVIANLASPHKSVPRRLTLRPWEARVHRMESQSVKTPIGSTPY